MSPLSIFPSFVGNLLYVILLTPVQKAFTDNTIGRVTALEHTLQSQMVDSSSDSVKVPSIYIKQEGEDAADMKRRISSFFALVYRLEGRVVEQQRLRPWLHSSVDLSDPHVRFYWPRSDWDYCIGDHHFMYSFHCFAAEAQYLNRTLVMKSTICLGPEHNNGYVSVQPMEAYYNLEALRSKLNWILEDDFQLAKQRQPDVPIRGGAYGLEYTSEQLWNRTNIKFLVRDLPVSDGKWRFGFDLCQRPGNPLRVRYLLKPAEEIVNIIRYIRSQLGKGYVALHVRRGDKLDPSRWPNLDRDTQPEAILQKLEGKVPRGSSLYISTNEDTPGFFDPLKQVYKVHCLEDFAHLWAEGSSWFKWFRLTFNQDPVFDSRMKVLVDYRVLEAATKRFRTFNDLTSDPKNGIAPREE